MKISFVIPPPDLSGGIRVIASIALGLRDRGHELGVFAPPRPVLWVSRKTRLKALLTGTRLPAPVPLTESHFDAIPFLHEIGPTDSIPDAKMPKADVVVATWWETAEWVNTYSSSKGVKVQFIQQYEANFGQPPGRIDAVWRLPMYKIVCSEWLAELARVKYGDTDVTVVRNGVDTNLFDASERGKQSRPTVGVMYSTQQPKSWATALAALIEAKRRLPDLRVLAFGAMPPASWLPLPVGVEFHLRPPQCHLREIYGSCDVWLCSSGSEGFHLPPHEAMACRCPVVSTRVGGPMDLVREGVNGHLVDPFDAIHLAEQLCRVLEMHDVPWRAMSKAAYDTARGLTWDAASAQFEAGLNAAMERSNRSSFAGKLS